MPNSTNRQVTQSGNEAGGIIVSSQANGYSTGPEIRYFTDSDSVTRDLFTASAIGSGHSEIKADRNESDSRLFQQATFSCKSRFKRDAARGVTLLSRLVAFTL